MVVGELVMSKEFRGWLAQNGASQELIELMNKPSMATRSANAEPIIMVMLNWFSDPTSNLKYKFSSSDTNWVDVNSIISTCSLTYEATSNLYWLDHKDVDSSDDFVANKIGFITIMSCISHVQSYVDYM